MAPTATARIEVFRPGTFTPMDGAPITYTAADLRAVVDAYDPETAPVPIVVGHPDTDAPAYGWVTGFDFDATADRLYADVGEIDPAFAEAVKAGRYKKISMSFFRPDQSANPVPGSWYPKHVGFLGGAAPAVAGLKNVHFSVTCREAATFAADFGSATNSARLFRGIRDLVIEKFGLETADRTLPAYEIDWLDEAVEPAPLFAAPPTPTPKEDPPVNTPNPDAAALAAREAALRDGERRLAHTTNVSFAEGLVTEGKLLPALQANVVALLDELPEAAEASVSFAQGQPKLSPGAALRQVLKGLPKVVEFGATDLGDDPGEGKGASFAADGKAVDRAGLVTHEKALAYQRTHPGTAYLDAVRAVS